jgi:hypothetical protein
MKLTREQARQITNLHIQLTNIGKVATAGQIIEMVLDILEVSHERYNDIEKKKFYFWRIRPESVSDID